MGYVRKTPVDKAQWFIDKAILKHGNKFGYENTAFKTSHEKVAITCEVHGDFMTTPTSHLAGSGCPQCGYAAVGRVNAITQEIFIAKANIIHSGRYDYSSVSYSKSREKVSIICPQHGVFTQAPNSHLSGHGCQVCAAHLTKERLSVGLQHFLKRANDAHGDRYDYNNVVFVNYNTKVEIICHVHGKFSQMPKHHADGSGCTKCAINSAAEMYSRTTEEFVMQSRQTHGDIYDYSLVEYKNSNSKVAITCREHGVFYQSAQSHISGRGCRKCSLQGGYSQLDAGTFYVLRCGDLTKIGITNKNAAQRASTISKSFGAEFLVLDEMHFEDGTTPLRVETALLKVLRSRHKSPSARFDGSTECFFEVDLEWLGNLIKQEVSTHG